VESVQNVEELSMKIFDILENGKSYGLVVSNKAFGKVLLSSFLNSVGKHDAIVIDPENNIGINEVRSVIDFLDFSPNGFSKVALFFDAEKMTQEAANAFLKTLEEPPRYAIIIIVTSRWHSLLPTIRSRLQRLHIPTPIPKELDEFGKYLILWNYDFLEDLKNGNFDILTADELFEYDELPDITTIMSLKNILEEYRKKGITEYTQFIQKLSKKSDMHFLRLVAKVVAWLIYKDESIPAKSKIKYLRICDEIQRTKIANFNYQLTYYTLLLGLRGDNL
jgi:DNA polymerase-3 subunit delta'/DNA polymerase-3 subunit gamma/tau